MAEYPHRAEHERGPRHVTLAAVDGRRVDDRGVTPALGKTLELGLVVLFIAGLTTVLLGGVVPDYQRATDATVGDRVLATASAQVEAAVPPTVGAVDTRQRVDLPAAIGDAGYAISVDGRWLVLEHPRVEGRVRLVLPASVTDVRGRWQSGAETVVRVHGDRSGLVVELVNGGPV